MAKSKMTNSRFAGELLVAAELTRLGLVVALHNSMGVNTPAFDMFVSNGGGEKLVPVQVKALKGPNGFVLDPEKLRPHIFYIFVVVGEAGTLPSFHIAQGAEILKREAELFGKWGRKYIPKHGRGIHSRRLPKDWLNNWMALGLAEEVSA